MAPIVEKIATNCVELGEAPHWDVDTQSLYYVDVFGKAIIKYTPSTNKTTKAIIGLNNVSFVIPVEGTTDKYLISLGRELAVVTWDGISSEVTSLETIGEGDVQGNGFNDGKCDSLGRLWAGTIGKGNSDPIQGSLYCLEPSRKIKNKFSPVFISNGLTWSLDNTKFYYIDSITREIFQFDFDVHEGSISNKQVIFSFDAHNIHGLPDGQTIDANGNLWIAVFNGHKVIQIDPRKPNTLLQTIEIPAKQVTSVAFGGPNMDELYVTTGSFTVDGVVLSPPHHGALYKITGLEVTGLPGIKLKL